MKSRGPRPDTRTASPGPSIPPGTTSRVMARRRARTTFGCPMSPISELISRDDIPRRWASTIAESRIEACDVVVDARPLVLLLGLDEVPAGGFEFRRHRVTISP